MKRGAAEGREAWASRAYTQVIESDTADGKRIRVRIGPYGTTRQEADKAAAGVLKAAGLPGQRC